MAFGGALEPGKADMITRGLTRRGVLTVLGAWAMAPLSRASAEQAPGADLRFGVITVDTSPLARKGLSAAATAAIHEQLALALAQVFADRMAPRQSPATLVARIDSFSLASYAGDDVGAFGGPTDTDYLEGAGLVVSGGRVLSTTPILSALAASYSGAWYLPDIDARRIASITHHFAYWLRREMGL